MKQFTLLVFSLWTITLNAQQWHTGTRWLYYQDDYMPDDIAEYNLFEVSKDTIIGNDSLLVLDEYYLISGITGLTHFGRYTYYIRQTGNKVYLKSQNSGQMDLLYDFDAVEGDTFTAKVPWLYAQSDSESILVPVDSVKPVVYNGTSWPTQFIQSLYNVNGFSFRSNILVGIGEMTYFFPAPGFVDPPPGGYLLCFQNGDVHFPAQDYCNIILPTIELPSNDVKIFPNPFTDQIYVEAEKISRWEIIAESGNRQLEGTVLGEIDIARLNSGRYFLVLYDRNRIVHIAKIVKADR